MKKLIYILLVFAAVGCNPAAKFSVTEARLPALYGLKSLHGRAKIENAGSRDLMVESANIVVRYRGRELCTARLLLPIEIPARGETEIRYDFALEGLSLSSMQTMQSRGLVSPGAFTVDVSGRVRWGGVGKKIEIKEVPLTRVLGIISNFAL